MSTDNNRCPWQSTSPVTGRLRSSDEDIQGGERVILFSTALLSTTTIIGVTVRKIHGMTAN